MILFRIKCRRGGIHWFTYMSNYLSWNTCRKLRNRNRPDVIRPDANVVLVMFMANFAVDDVNSDFKESRSEHIFITGRGSNQLKGNTQLAVKRPVVAVLRFKVFELRTLTTVRTYTNLQ